MTLIVEDFAGLEIKLRNFAKEFVSEVLTNNCTSFYSIAQKAGIVSIDDLRFIGLYTAVLDYASCILSPKHYWKPFTNRLGRLNRKRECYPMVNNDHFLRTKKLRRRAPGRKELKQEITLENSLEDSLYLGKYQNLQKYEMAVEFLGILTDTDTNNLFLRYELLNMKILEYNSRAH